ncbi:hypothetical protein D9757_006162 [Collybiopsis confluens]|uniref:Calpain catalytic domain-containing protein n=1 Tax=Collybiopsis confluens TaxID=2823264 RepID=A0A8H5M776_9AGAR|nr:hypothetical protein D9757_006162 [Collybiopsis confluens]
MQRAQDAESTYSKATKSELAKDYDSAFRLYVKAAESFLHLIKSVPATEQDRLQWNSHASRALERAERIKLMTDKTRTSQKPPLNPSEIAQKLTPVAVDYFSPEEQSSVLRRGGNINGMVFPLWREDPGPSSIQKQPKLSSLQNNVSAIWKAGNQDILTEVRPIFPQDIFQNVVTDCSVCASISSCIEHDIRFGSNVGLAYTTNDWDGNRSHFLQLAKGIIHPIGSRSPNRVSFYDLKLYFNGDWRRVSVFVPLSQKDANVCPRSVSSPRPPFQGVSNISQESMDSCRFIQPQVFICALHVERRIQVRAMLLCRLYPGQVSSKKYMTLMGGYDFPGSNSTIDLHALTGWIPEHIDIKRSGFEGEKTWARILNGFSSGRCMLTFGTGHKKNIRWEEKKLLPTHSYAALNVRETEKERIVTVLDSWVHSESPELASLERPGLLDIPWLDALDIFDGIYLNWDPKTWSSQLTYHGIWRAQDNKKGCIHQVRATFQVSNSEERDEIWVLLTRHVNDTRNSDIFIACKVQIEDNEAGSSVVCGRQKLSNKGAYTNSPHVLTRTKVPPLNNSASLSILALCEGSSEDLGFDLTIYVSRHLKLAWEKDVVKFPFSEPLEGTLTNKNSGGNHTHPTFLLNPQYHLRVGPPKQSSSRTKERTIFVVETNKDLPIQLICFRPSQKNITATSGMYTYGLARVTTQLAPGDYTVIISAFEPFQTGAYTLTVNSFAQFDMSTIPQEGAGMYRKTAKGSWNASSAAGAPSFNRYFQNPIFEVNLPSQAQIQIRLQLLRPSSSISLNVTVYSASENLASDRHVMTSGPYDDAITGVITLLTSLPAGRYWVVPSTYNPGTQTDFQLIVFSTLASTGLAPKLS